MTTLEGCAGMAWAGVGSSSSSSEDEISPSVECSSLPSIGSISQSVLVSETASSSRMWLSAEGRQKVETALSTSISGTGCPRLHGPGPWPV